MTCFSLHVGWRHACCATSASCRAVRFMQQYKETTCCLSKIPSSCRNIVMGLVLPAQRNFVSISAMPAPRSRCGSSHSRPSHCKVISTSNFLCTPTKTRPPQCELEMRSIDAANGRHSFCRPCLLPCQQRRLPWQAWTVELSAATRV